MGNDRRLPHREKKSLIDEIPDILETGRTNHPLLSRIALARLINQSSGAGIAPWEVDQLDEIWLDAFRFSVDDLQTASHASKKIQDVHNAWLARWAHPFYKSS